MISVTGTSVPVFGDEMTIINITQGIVDSFISHGEKEYPHECCGFILGHFRGDESESGLI